MDMQQLKDAGRESKFTLLMAKEKQEITELGAHACRFRMNEVQLHKFKRYRVGKKGQ